MQGEDIGLLSSSVQISLELAVLRQEWIPLQGYFGRSLGIATRRTRESISCSKK